jgi:hypothetical protein
MKEETKRRHANRGCFKPGFDPRRHRFTREEYQAGFWKALESIIVRFPDAVDNAGRHMACDFLRVAGRSVKRRLRRP